MSHVSWKFGGIAVSVPELAHASEMEGVFDCPIAGFCDPAELSTSPAATDFRTEFYSPSRSRYYLSNALRDRLKQTIAGADGLHIHGLWETHCALTAGLARAVRKPYIVSAHGMLEDWALRQKRLKKAIYAALIEARTLRHATCLRALTPDEVDDYRRVGIRTPVAIVPGGVYLPPDVSAGVFLNEHPHLRDKHLAIFIGRLHPKKGLDLLLRAWSRAATAKREHHLVIAGPDSEGTLASLRSLRESLGLNDRVTLLDAVSGDLKWSMLRAASVFALPSHSEGFSIALLEAMGAELPVIATTGCHVPEVATERCGWLVAPTVDALTGAVEDYLAMPAGERLARGQRGSELVRNRFEWSVVGRQMNEVYEWINGGGRPATVPIAI